MNNHPNNDSYDSSLKIQNKMVLIINMIDDPIHWSTVSNGVRAHGTRAKKVRKH